MGVKITCKDSGSGCKTGTRTDTIKKSTTYYVYDNAGNKGSCGVSVTSRKVYSRRTRSYDSCKTGTTGYKGTCKLENVSSSVASSPTYRVTVTGSTKAKCKAACKAKYGSSGVILGGNCTYYSTCKGGYSSWSSWSSYTKTSCTTSKTVQCQGPQTQYK